MMRLAICLALSLCAGSAWAQARPYTPKLSCRAVAGIIASRGFAVLSMSPTTYDRFVADRRFCQPSEVLEPAWVPTADSRYCFIGYRCKEFEFDDF